LVLAALGERQPLPLLWKQQEELESGCRFQREERGGVQQHFLQLAGFLGEVEGQRNYRKTELGKYVRLGVLWALHRREKGMEQPSERFPRELVALRLHFHVESVGCEETHVRLR